MLDESINTLLRTESKRLNDVLDSLPVPDPKAYIDPLNPYTGEVSVMALMKNHMNGHTSFPRMANIAYWTSVKLD